MSSLYGGRGPTGSVQGERIPKGYQKGSLANFTPEQMQLFQQMFSQVSPDSYTGRLATGDESLFGEMEAPALRQFNELQGNIASRFSGMGMGGRRSSGFQNTMSAAGSNLTQDLQARRQELQRQAIMDLMGMSSNLLGQKPYENFVTQKKPSFWESILGMGGSALGQFGGTAAGMSGSLLPMKWMGML